MIDELKSTLHNNFKLKDLGTLKYFLGMEIGRSDHGIVMNQSKYALELISDMGLSGSKTVSTPFELNLKLTSKEYDDFIEKQSGGKQKSTDKLLDDPKKFKRLIGRLLYLTITRPDISYSVNHISQFMHRPKDSHYQAALRIIRYVKKDPGQGLFMPKINKLEVKAYCDSDWASCILERKSVTGFCVKLGDSLISWRSRKQKTVSRSSAEAEYRSMADTVAELMWIRGILQELGVKIDRPIDLYCDSEAAIHISANPVYHERTKHIEIDCHLVRQQISNKLINTVHISTGEQPADVFTKGLGAYQHEHLLKKLGLKDIFSDRASSSISNRDPLQISAC
ncbi:uncharacterized mitochondrial protein AtMg00810-like [Rutidosis leptorrhynchoides]|uniref:uncharacterized mitochondrial protein AtMg00810-like n=1 Tax=Rutidosis leptorrhynchoides TaxID=125765 RepID=UPI003A993169